MVWNIDQAFFDRWLDVELQQLDPVPILRWHLLESFARQELACCDTCRKSLVCTSSILGSDTEVGQSVRIVADWGPVEEALGHHLLHQPRLSWSRTQGALRDQEEEHCRASSA